MPFSALLMALLLPMLAVGSGSFLDIEELNNIHYSVNIGDVPILEDAITTPEQVTMVNKLGQKYRCQLPKLKEADSEDNKDGEGLAPHDVVALLSPLQEMPCLFKTKDWWTYEFCHGRHIKQYHMENDKPVGVVMMLGVAQVEENEPVNENLRYFPQWFSNGSRCDLTGRPRRTEVRFVCEETAQMETIGEILEPQSCEYTMVVHTNRLCSVPWLRPQADAAPLPIKCSPMLSTEQLDKFTRYQEVKARQAMVLKAKREEEQRASLMKQLDGEDLSQIDIESQAGLDVLQSMVGDKVADKMVLELNSLLDTALKQQGGGGAIKVVDLRGNNLGKEKIMNSLLKSKKPKQDSEEDEKEEKEGRWDVVHGGHKNYFRSDPAVQKHLRERNTLWRKIHETKKRITKLKSQIQDHANLIKNHAETSSKEALALFYGKKTELEEQLVVAKESLVMLEDAARDVSHSLVHAQQESRKNMVKERLDEIRKLMQSGTAQPKDYHVVLAKLKRDYKSMTGKTLLFMSQWFELVEKDVQDQDLEKIRTFMKFADGELPSVTEVSGSEPSGLDDVKQEDGDDEMEEFDQKIDSLSGKEKQRLGKIRNVLKDDLKDQFAEILKEVKDDLDLEEADLDRDLAMDKLAETLDDLMGKLSGAEEKIDRVHKHVEKVKKMVDTANKEENGKDSIHVDGILSPNIQKEGTKHDGKKSVKKELNDAEDEIFGEDDKELVKSDEEENFNYEEAHQQLLEVEKKLVDLNQNLEYETKQLQKLTKLQDATKASPDVLDGKDVLDKVDGKDALDDPNKVEVKITKINSNPKSLDGPLSSMSTQDDKIVKKLETSIKDKLEKFGLETGGKIEVKLITTTLPIGDVDGMDGLGMDGEEAQQYQNMVYNLLTGNQAGYDDIDSQRKAEKNYKFSWDDSILEETPDEIYVSPQDIEGVKSVLHDIDEERVHVEEISEEDSLRYFAHTSEDEVNNEEDEPHDEL